MASNQSCFDSKTRSSEASVAKQKTQDLESYKHTLAMLVGVLVRAYNQADGLGFEGDYEDLTGMWMHALSIQRHAGRRSPRVDPNQLSINSHGIGDAASRASG